MNGTKPHEQRRRSRRPIRDRDNGTVRMPRSDVVYQWPKLLCRKDETQLVLRAQRGDWEARNQLWVRYVRVVFSVVQRLYVPTDLIDDAIQAGTLGVAKAIEQYDVRIKRRFSIYAHWCVQIQVARFVRQLAFHLPMTRREMNAYRRYRSGRLDTVVSGSDTSKTGVGLERTVRAISQCCNRQQLQFPESLTERESPKVREASSERIALVLQIVERELDARQASVIRMRFGLYDYPAHSLRAVSQKFGCSPERIRQIESHAMDFIRRRYAVLSRDALPTQSDFLQFHEEPEGTAPTRIREKRERSLQPSDTVVRHALASLTIDEAAIAARLFGLAGFREMILLEAAQSMGCSQHRAKKLLASATTTLIEMLQQHRKPGIRELVSRIRAGSPKNEDGNDPIDDSDCLRLDEWSNPSLAECRATASV